MLLTTAVPAPRQHVILDYLHFRSTSNPSKHSIYSVYISTMAKVAHQPEDERYWIWNLVLRTSCSILSAFGCMCRRLRTYASKKICVSLSAWLCSSPDVVHKWIGGLLSWIANIIQLGQLPRATWSGGISSQAHLHTWSLLLVQKSIHDDSHFWFGGLSLFDKGPKASRSDRDHGA